MVYYRTFCLLGIFKRWCQFAGCQQEILSMVSSHVARATAEAEFSVPFQKKGITGDFRSESLAELMYCPYNINHKRRPLNDWTVLKCIAALRFCQKLKSKVWLASMPPQINHLFSFNCKRSNYNRMRIILIALHAAQMEFKCCRSSAAGDEWLTLDYNPAQRWRKSSMTSLCLIK